LTLFDLKIVELVASTILYKVHTAQSFSRVYTTSIYLSELFSKPIKQYCTFEAVFKDEDGANLAPTKSWETDLMLP
jgi:hypothetical protein